MITLLLRPQTAKVDLLSHKIEYERLLLRALRQETRVNLQRKLGTGWGLFGSFSAGFLSVRFGGRAARALRSLPLMQLARQLWAHLLV